MPNQKLSDYIESEIKSENDYLSIDKEFEIDKTKNSQQPPRHKGIILIIISVLIFIFLFIPDPSFLIYVFTETSIGRITAAFIVVIIFLNIFFKKRLDMNLFVIKDQTKYILYNITLSIIILYYSFIFISLCRFGDSTGYGGYGVMYLYIIPLPIVFIFLIARSILLKKKLNSFKEKNLPTPSYLKVNKLLLIVTIFFIISPILLGLLRNILYI